MLPEKITLGLAFTAIAPGFELKNEGLLVLYEAAQTEEWAEEVV